MPVEGGPETDYVRDIEDFGMARNWEAFSVAATGLYYLAPSPDKRGALIRFINQVGGAVGRNAYSDELVNKADLDRVQPQQVFMNLTLNGIEAMEDSGGELTVKSELHDSQLQLSVSNTGAGLPTEKMDQIFFAFFTAKPQGSGMGLAISRSIVELHGGRLCAAAND